MVYQITLEDRKQRLVHEINAIATNHQQAISLARKEIKDSECKTVIIELKIISKGVISKSTLSKEEAQILKK